jgi:hypothetical protein
VDESRRRCSKSTSSRATRSADAASIFATTDLAALVRGSALSIAFAPVAAFRGDHAFPTIWPSDLSRVAHHVPRTPVQVVTDECHDRYSARRVKRVTRSNASFVKRSRKYHACACRASNSMLPILHDAASKSCLM